MLWLTPENEAGSAESIFFRIIDSCDMQHM